MTTVMSHDVNESRVAEKNRQENQKIAKKIIKLQNIGNCKNLCPLDEQI